MIFLRLFPMAEIFHPIRFNPVVNVLKAWNDGQPMRRLLHPALLLFLLLSLSEVVAAQGEQEPHAAGYWLANRFSDRLGGIESRLKVIFGDLQKLPVMPDLDALGTHGFHSNFTGTSEQNWFQIEWDQPRRIDGVAMIPTRLTTQSGQRSNYGLPNRLRIEVKRAGSDDFVPLFTIEDTHLDQRRGDPLFVTIPPTEVLALRFVPIDLPTLPGKWVRFFSLSELMVFDGGGNIAPFGQLSAPFSIDTEVGWNIRYLTDAQSPLGPPEFPLPGRSLGWHAENGETEDSHCFACIDLGRARRFESIRLIAACGDAPIKGPGFGFPKQFDLECGDSPIGPWRLLWSTGEKDFPNPGYNPAIFRFPEASGRYVRLSVTKFDAPDLMTVPRVLLSELEVIHDGKNLAVGCPVTTSDRRASIPHDATRVWSVAGLTDGYSSTGRVMPLRKWAEELSDRFDLLCEQRTLLSERDKIVSRYHNLFLFSVFSLLGLAIFGMMLWQFRIRLHNRRQVVALRRRISSDLHDEVGSNLATIALLSELAPAPGHLDDINRLSRETTQSLHEIVDITLAPKRARKPIADRLRDIASLMLREHHWTFDGHASPEIDLEQRRNLVFYFKESLHNIIRHAEARNVTITLEEADRKLRLTITDDGKGIRNPSTDVAGNLHTLRQRADSLHGELVVDSSPERGTRLTLSFPLRSKSRP